MLRAGVRAPLALLLLLDAASLLLAVKLSDERVVFQTAYGDIEFGVYPDVAPVTAPHIMRLAKLGAYNTNHFFRVDKGFVAQVAGVKGGRQCDLDVRQQVEASKTVPLEVRPDVKHTRRGILSMARSDDPHSGGSSFSILLGTAPHLDMNYAIFGEVTRGLDVLTKMEALETRREGIFVMPRERVTILSSYVHCEPCEEEARDLRARLVAANGELERIRAARLPGN